MWKKNFFIIVLASTRFSHKQTSSLWVFQLFLSAEIWGVSNFVISCLILFFKLGEILSYYINVCLFVCFLGSKKHGKLGRKNCNLKMTIWNIVFFLASLINQEKKIWPCTFQTLTPGSSHLPSFQRLKVTSWWGTSF